MPGNVRNNSVTGQAETDWTSPNGQTLWVPLLSMMAALPDGHEVKLNNAQRSMLADIQAKAALLDQVVTKLTENKGSVDQVKAAVDGISTTRIGDVLTQLAAIRTSTDAGTAANSAQAADLTAIRAAILAQATPLALIKDYTTTLAAINTVLGSILTASQTTANSVGLPGTETLKTINLANAQQQYSYAIPANAKRFWVMARGDRARSDQNADIRYAWASGIVAPASGTGAPQSEDYGIIPAGTCKTEDVNFPAARTIYFASPVANVNVSVGVLS